MWNSLTFSASNLNEDSLATSIRVLCLNYYIVISFFVVFGSSELPSTKIFFTKILGLDICGDTLVGDEMLKGISGGQKKRLTTG